MCSKLTDIVIQVALWQNSLKKYHARRSRAQISFMISTNWLTPFSPGKRGWNDQIRHIVASIEINSTIWNINNTGWSHYLSWQEFCHDAPSRADIYSGGVLGCTEYQFGGSVVSRANVRYVWLYLNQKFAFPKSHNFNWWVRGLTVMTRYSAEEALELLQLNTSLLLIDNLDEHAVVHKCRAAPDYSP